MEKLANNETPLPDATSEPFEGSRNEHLHAAIGNFPPGMPQTYAQQRYIAEILNLQSLVGSPELWATMKPQQRLAMFAIAAASVEDLTERINTTTQVILGRLNTALAESPYGAGIKPKPDTKTVVSTLEKLARRHSKDDPDKHYLPVSDEHRFMLIGDNPMELLQDLRMRFGVSEVWLDGRESVYEGRNPHNPWSHKDYFGRRGKFYTIIDGEVVLFEVQAYTQEEYDTMYIPTRRHYDESRCGETAIKAAKQ